MIGDSTYGNCLDYENSDMTYQEREDLRQYALERAKEGSAKAEWMIVRIGLQNYVSKMYVWQEDQPVFSFLLIILWTM